MVSAAAVCAILIFLFVLVSKYLNEPGFQGPLIYNATSYELIGSLPAAFLALNCHNNFFQIKSSMRIQDVTDRRVISIFGSAFAFVATVYATVAIMGVKLYGSDLN
jgi:amino acid permease